MALNYLKVVLSPPPAIEQSIASPFLYTGLKGHFNLDRIINYKSVMFKSHFLTIKLNLMKKFKQLAMMSFLLGTLLLFGSTSVNAQYVGETEAMSILEQELSTLKVQKIAPVSNPASLSEQGQTTASGNLLVEVRAKKLFYTNLLGNIKEGDAGVGAAISQTYGELGNVFGANQDRQSLLDAAEQAAQNLLQD